MARRQKDEVMRLGFQRGDNLALMRAMPDACVDLIYTDPPFNSGRNYKAAAGAFTDKWKDGDEYLGFLYPRLTEMRRLMKPTASIYLHCDPTSSHYIKVAMDGIFGRRNFINEIVWCYSTVSSAKRHYPRKHDSILFYSNGGGQCFNGDAVRVPHLHLIKPGESMFGQPAGRLSAERAEHLNKRGSLPKSWWADIGTVMGQAKENTKYPTQKPVKLLERIIKASSNVGDIVFDPFCGSGTTFVAAANLGRLFAGIDIADNAALIASRLPNRLALDKPPPAAK